MNYQKLDAGLSEALAEPETRDRYDVFVEITPDAAARDVDRLAELGVSRSSDSETIVTARLSREDLRAVSEVPSVRQLRLRRRLRYS